MTVTCIIRLGGRGSSPEDSSPIATMRAMIRLAKQKILSRFISILLVVSLDWRSVCDCDLAKAIDRTSALLLVRLGQAIQVLLSAKEQVAAGERG